MRYDYMWNETRDGIISWMKRDGMIIIGLKHESGLWLEWNMRSDIKHEIWL